MTPNKVFIEYWLLYKLQENCVGDTGGHDYNLEHIIVQYSGIGGMSIFSCPRQLE